MIRRPLLLTLALPVLVLGLVLATAGSDTPPPPRPLSADQAMVEAADRFLQGLDGADRERAAFDLDDQERFDWHFIPRERRGLPLSAMDPGEREAAHALLAAATSSQGYQKAIGVMQLEEILGQIEGRPRMRDPEAYFFSVFGTPSLEQPWGWRFEGHHISLNFTSAGGVTVTTPAFMGANPATVPSGTYAGWRLLGPEEELARELVRTLADGRRARAVIAAEAPDDIITGADRRASLDGFQGLPVSEMSPVERALLDRLLLEYLGNMEPEVASAQREKIEDAGLDRLHFAWAGSLEPGQGHYYRIHGPTVLIEYDNTQNGANHVHSVWRDLTDDFGEDLLRRHYEEADHHR